MALIRTAANKVRRGVVGQDTFYYTDGRQIVRQSRNNSNFGENAQRTRRQMSRRVMWSNLVNTYQLFMAFSRSAYEGLRPGQSAFTEFMRLNIPLSTFPLSKEEAAQEYVAPTSFIMSSGKLPSIEFTDSATIGTLAASNILVSQVTEASSVGDISASIALVNNDFKEGDNIAFFGIFLYNKAAGFGKAYSEYAELTLDSNSDESFDETTFQRFVTIQDSKLVIKEGANLAAACLIHTRKQKGKLVVSRQSLIVSDAVSAAIATANTPARLLTCMESYGELHLPLIY